MYKIKCLKYFIQYDTVYCMDILGKGKKAYPVKVQEMSFILQALFIVFPVYYIFSAGRVNCIYSVGTIYCMYIVDPVYFMSCINRGWS